MTPTSHSDRFNHRKEPLHVRFRLKVDKRGEDECWPWLAYKSPAGYGFIGVGGKKVPAAQVSLILDGRPRPDGMLSLHSCDNPPCVNPKHLRWGTDLENKADMRARNRHPTGERHSSRTMPECVPRGEKHWSKKKLERRPKGSGHGSAKLRDEDVLSIRGTKTKLHIEAAKYGVSISAISAIRLRKSWTHI